MRVLLLSDTHLGCGCRARSTRPRPHVVDLPRRDVSTDYFERAYARALEPATSHGDVDLVVHAGDLFHRPDVEAARAHRAFARLIEAAEGGTPVLIVPGNHERSQIPYALLLRHPAVFIFDAPKTWTHTLRAGWRVAVAGFPFAAEVRPMFRSLVEQTRWRAAGHGVDLRLLCLHQAVEGATVGAHHFTFRRGTDVIAGRHIPQAFDAVLSGHIHRAQRLTRDLAGRRLDAPVLYPGSTERTAFAERDETKGYLLLDFERHAGGAERPRLAHARFVALPSRPMAIVSIDLSDQRTLAALTDEIGARLAAIDPEATVRVDISGAERLPTAQLSPQRLRRVTPPTMSLRVRLVRSAEK